MAYRRGFFWVVLAVCLGLLERWYAHRLGHDALLVARVYGHKLYQNELDLWLASMQDPATRKEKRRAYIKRWIDQHLMLAAATRSQELDTQAVEKSVQKYKETLLVQAFLDQQAQKQSCLLASKQEVEDYYKKNQHQFLLSSPIFRGQCVVISQGTPGGSKVRLWMQEGGGGLQESLASLLQ